MIAALVITAVVLLVTVIVMLVLVLRRATTTDISPITSRLDAVEASHSRMEREVKAEIASNRTETANQARDLRDEVRGSFKDSTESLVQSVGEISTAQQQGLKGFADQLNVLKQTVETSASQARTELSRALKDFQDSLQKQMKDMAELQKQQLDSFATQLADATDKSEKKSTELRLATETSSTQTRSELTTVLKDFQDSVQKQMKDMAELQKQQLDSFATQLADATDKSEKKSTELRLATETSSTQTRAELSTVLKDFKDSLQKQMKDMADLQKQQLDSFAAQLVKLTEKIEKKSDELRTAVEGKLTELQADNAAKLEAMRSTVDEKLQGTLDKRLGESFKQVSDRLEQVHKGLGDMQSLASGVGDLKRVLTNVKTRGIWAEMQLGDLLEQILTIDQFGRNVRTKSTGGETVEFAVKLPGPGELDGKVVWLPIDAKFPKEDYERLVDASERGDAAGVEQAAKNLEARVRSQARDIAEKYLEPPQTTDFGVLYLPTEGLYAEVLRRPGLMDSLQRERRVLIAGPTILAALLNSLRMGFRTLAIQKRSSEVWEVLAGVKAEFGKFGTMLDKVKKKLNETSNTIDDAALRSRQIERKLRRVEALPRPEGITLLAEADLEEADEEELAEIP